MEISLKVIEKDHEYIVIRVGGEYHQHGHIKKKQSVNLLLDLISKNRLPKSEFLQGTCRRLLTEEEYCRLKPKKQMYYNSNRGVRRCSR